MVKHRQHAPPAPERLVHVRARFATRRLLAPLEVALEIHVAERVRADVSPGRVRALGVRHDPTDEFKLGIRFEFLLGLSQLPYCNYTGFINKFSLPLLELHASCTGVE